MISVSVIMCVFNTKIEYLQAAIESILEQTLINIQFIIVNDGSVIPKVNRYLEECKSRDYRITVIHNKENIGLTKSLNLGLKKCKGKYVARMDSDDIAKPERLFKQFDYLEKHPEIDVLGTNVEQIGNKSIHMSKFKNYMTKDEEVFAIKMLFNNVGPMHPTVMIRKQFLDDNHVTYRENIKKAQDYALWIDCLKANAKFFCLNEKLLEYRLHENQITVHDSKEQLKFKEMISQKYIIEKFEIDSYFAGVLSTLYTEKFEYSVADYIKAINMLLNMNTHYSEKKLKKELEIRWIHKVIKNILFSKNFNGLFSVYTYKCLFSSAIVEWFKDYGGKNG